MPHFSQGVECFLAAIGRGRQPTGWRTFPVGTDPQPTRYRNTDLTVHGWFSRCVDQALGGRTEPCQIEDNIGLFATVRWREGASLTHARIQAVVTPDSDLTSFYCSASVQAHYLRLDVDLHALGPMLKEPFPHVHCFGAGEPRFPFSNCRSGNVIGDFLDFVYRNYRYDDWLSWLRRVWDGRAGDRDPETDPFYVLQEAYVAGKVEVLMQEPYRSALVRLKRCVVEAKREAFDLKIDGGTAEILGFDWS